MGNEVQTLTLGEVFWLITDICIVVALTAFAIAVIIWWLRGGFNDAHRAKTYCHSMFTNAECADEWMNKYYEEKREHSDSVAFYTGAMERKDKKIETMCKMDEQRIKRIQQLEGQLKDNGIEPEVWVFTE